MRHAVLAGFAAASLTVGATAQAASSCAALREPAGVAALQPTSRARRPAGEKLALWCEGQEGAGASYRLSVSRTRADGGADTLKTVTGSCEGKCPISLGDRAGAARPASARHADDLLVTVDF